MVKVKYLGIYDYVPSEAAAIVFAILFLIPTALHTWQLFRTKTWFFIPFLIGCIFEVIGYIARADSSTEYPNYSMGPEIVQYMFILVAPALLAASIYMEFGRLMIMADGEKYSIIRRTWLTKIFVCGDIISFFAQFLGAAMLAKTSTASKGEDVMKIGVLIQLLFFALFLVTIIIFHRRLLKHRSKTFGLVPWKKHIYAIYVTGLLIFVRSCFRFAEFVESSDGPLTKYEWISYVFDAVLILASCGIMNWIYPSEIAEHIKSTQEYRSEHEMQV